MSIHPYLSLCVCDQALSDHLACGSPPVGFSSGSVGCVSGSGLALSEAHPGKAMLPAPPLSHHLGSSVWGSTALASLGSSIHTDICSLSLWPPTEQTELGPQPCCIAMKTGIAVWGLTKSQSWTLRCKEYLCWRQSWDEYYYKTAHNHNTFMQKKKKKGL